MPPAACYSAMTGLHARLEHFNWGYDERSDDAGEGPGDEGGVGVVGELVYGAGGGEAQPVVAGEVDYVCRDCHDEGGGEAAPEGCDSLVSRDLAEGVEGRVESAPLRFFHRAVDGAHGIGGAQSPYVGTGDAVFDRVAGEEDFAAAGGNAEVGGKGPEAFDCGGAREVCDGGVDGGVWLGLETDADDVEGGDCVQLLAKLGKSRRRS